MAGIVREFESVLVFGCVTEPGIEAEVGSAFASL